MGEWPSRAKKRLVVVQHQPRQRAAVAAEVRAVGEVERDRHLAQDAAQRELRRPGPRPVRRRLGHRAHLRGLARGERVGDVEVGLGGGHAIPFGARCGVRVTTGRRRSQSRTPCQRMSAVTRWEARGSRSIARRAVRRVAGCEAAVDRAGEDLLVALGQRDGDRDPVVGEPGADVVAALDGEERRDVELLVAWSRRRDVGVGRQRVDVPLAVGVVDLGQDALERAVGGEDEVRRQRVEDVAGGAGVGQHQHPVGAPGQALLVEQDAQLLAAASRPGCRGGRRPGCWPASATGAGCRPRGRGRRPATAWSGAGRRSRRDACAGGRPSPARRTAERGSPGRPDEVVAGAGAPDRSRRRGTRRRRGRPGSRPRGSPSRGRRRRRRCVRR